jgi:hypothetical protein
MFRGVRARIRTAIARRLKAPPLPIGLHGRCRDIAYAMELFGAPRRIRTATARNLSPSPLPVGLVERNGATGADRTRGLVLDPGTRSPDRATAAMVPARVVDSLASALRGRRSTLSYAGMDGAGRQDRTSTLALQNPCTSLCCAGVKSTNGRDQPGQLEKHSLPETTVCRSTEGDRYRPADRLMSSQGRPSCIRNQFTSSRDLTTPAAFRWAELG